MYVAVGQLPSVPSSDQLKQVVLDSSDTVKVGYATAEGAYLQSKALIDKFSAYQDNPQRILKDYDVSLRSGLSQSGVVLKDPKTGQVSAAGVAVAGIESFWEGIEQGKPVDKALGDAAKTMVPLAAGAACSAIGTPLAGAACAAVGSFFVLAGERIASELKVTWPWELKGKGTSVTPMMKAEQAQWRKTFVERNRNEVLKIIRQFSDIVGSHPIDAKNDLTALFNKTFRSGLATRPKYRDGTFVEVGSYEEWTTDSGFAHREYLTNQNPKLRSKIYNECEKKGMRGAVMENCSESKKREYWEKLFAEYLIAMNACVLELVSKVANDIAKRKTACESQSCQNGQKTFFLHPSDNYKKSTCCCPGWFPKYVDSVKDFRCFPEPAAYRRMTEKSREIASKTGASVAQAFRQVRQDCESKGKTFFPDGACCFPEWTSKDGKCVPGKQAYAAMVQDSRRAASRSSVMPTVAVVGALGAVGALAYFVWKK